jgi:hypothetical protein
LSGFADGGAFSLPSAVTSLALKILEFLTHRSELFSQDRQSGNARLDYFERIPRFEANRSADTLRGWNFQSTSLGRSECCGDPANALDRSKLHPSSARSVNCDRSLDRMAVW